MDRTRQMLPVVFLLIGASAGICWAMLYRHGNAERTEVKLDASLPPCLIGAVVGGIVGQLLLEGSKRQPRIARSIVIISAGLLSAALAAPIGWIVGDEWADRAGETGMLIGAVAGAIVGLVIGATRVASQRAENNSEAERENYREPDGGPAA